MTEQKEEPCSPAPLQVLTLDGGGAKGFYTLGMLKEIEAMMGYRWFGAELGSRLPDLSNYGRARQTRANAQGVKVERANQRVLAKGAFKILVRLDAVLQRLSAIKRTV